MNFIRSGLLPANPHGFFTRQGGTSTGIYDSLNCGFGSDDQHKNVNCNRAIVASEFGIKPKSLISTHQYHSTNVITISQPTEYRPNVKADAMVTNQLSLGLGVLTADCAPILFSDPDAGVIGAAHAGWRGALDGIVSSTVQAMLDLGAKRDHISAVIGPCISQNAYEVGPEFVDRFTDQNTNFDRYFAHAPSGKAHFDLPEFVLFRIKEQGLNKQCWTGDCTYSKANEYYSFRRNTHNNISDYGRQISVITLPTTL